MNTPIKSHCNICGPYKDHVVLHNEKTFWNAEEDSIHGGTEYYMLRCCGCAYISLRATSWNSDERDEDGCDSTITCYPPLVFRQLPKWHSDLQTYLNGERIIYILLKEVYVALQNDLRQLTAMGVRSILEHMIIDKVGDQGTFKKNLKEFEAKGYVATKQREFLEVVLEAGHASIHRSFTPSKEDLITLIDITESMVESAFLHDSKINTLKSRIPPRVKK